MPGQKTGLDVSSLSRRCEADGCAKWPLYGNEGEKAKFCSFHKSASMIDVRSRRCAAPGCKRQPSYAVEGKRAAFCAAHKEEGMVDVVSRRCEEPNCRRRPLYGYEGQRSQFCSAHKKEGQVDVCNRRCARPGCSKRPCFGLPGQRPAFCGSHRSPEMVDVISRKCGYPGCTRPTGHEAGRVRSKFCDKHKSAGLVGASLLQLAGATAEDSAAAGTSAGKAKGAEFSRQPPPLDEKTGALWNNSSSFSNNPGLGGLPEDRRGQQVELALARPAVPEVPSRRATYNAPLAPATRAPVSPEPPDHPRRRATMPAPLLPSVQSLLTRIPPGRLKRPRVGDANDDPSRFSLRTGQQCSSSPREQLGGVAGTCLGGDSEGAGKDDRCEDNSKPGKPAAALEGIPTAATSSGGSDRRQQQPGDRWAERRGSWNLNPRLNHRTPGFVASTPVPEWRRVDLASLGRAASFDEAAAALRANGLHPQPAAEEEEDPSKPRRSSAFVSHGSALPPLVTEMGRRDSAFEPRALAPVAWRRVPHYSDLLSARAPSRVVPAVNSHRSYHSPFAAPTPGGATLQPGPTGARTGAGAGASAAGGGRGRRGGGIPPPAVVSGAAARMFHVMPATAAFTAGLAAPSWQGAEDGGGGGGGARRLSVTPRPQSGPAAKEGQGAMLVPAWGAPPEAEKGYGDGGAPDKMSLAASSAGALSGAGTGGEFESSRRQPRRDSMAPGPAPQAEARRSSVVGIAMAPPAGGVIEQERRAEGPTSERRKSGDVAGSRSGSSQGEGTKDTGGLRRGSLVSGPGRNVSESGDSFSRTGSSTTTTTTTNNNNNIGGAAGNVSPPMFRGSVAKTGDRRGAVTGAGALCAMLPPSAPAPSEARRSSVVGGVTEPPGAMGPPPGNELSGARDSPDVWRGSMAPTRLGEVPADVGMGVRSERQEQH